MNDRLGIEEHLRKLIIDLYDFIVDESGKAPVQAMPSIFQRVIAHETYDSLVVLIAQDDSLAKFFPVLRETQDKRHEADFLKRLQSVVIWSDGSSEGMTIPTLCCSIIGGVFRVLWSWSDDPSLQDALGQLPKIIDLARDLARGRRIKVPAVVAIHNVELTHDRAIPIGSAVLRKPIRFDRSHLLGTAFGPDMDAALRFNVDFRVLHIRSTDQSKDRDKEHEVTLKLIEARGHRSQEEQDRRVQDFTDLSRLAIILCSSPGQFFAPISSWSAVINPLTEISASGMSNARILRAPYPAQSISVSIERQVDRYAKLLERYADALKTGIRRLLLAITERLYPEDGLVDAVICWESLFSGTPETMLRVCGSLAKLLGPSDIEGRRRVYNELRSLYLARNRVVHGAEARPAIITNERDAAVQYALDAFRAILQRQDLLGISGSAERGLSSLLGP